MGISRDRGTIQGADKKHPQSGKGWQGPDSPKPVAKKKATKDKK